MGAMATYGVIVTRLVLGFGTSPRIAHSREILTVPQTQTLCMGEHRETGVNGGNPDESGECSSLIDRHAE